MANTLSDPWTTDPEFSSFYQREQLESDAEQEAKVAIPISNEHFNALADEYNSGVDYEILTETAPFVDKFAKSSKNRGL